MNRTKFKKIVFALFAIAAVAAVVWAVPIDDRCRDPHAPTSTRARVTYLTDGCVLHLKSGSVTITRSACNALVCEPGLRTVGSRARASTLLLLLTGYLVSIWAYAARWRALLSIAGIRWRTWDLWRITTLAQVGGVVLPGGIGGDALRIVRAVDAGVPGPIATATIVLDRLIGLATLCGLAFVLWRFMGGGGGYSPFVLFLAALPLSVFALLALLRRIALSRSPRSLGRLEKTLGPIVTYFQEPSAPGHLLRATAWSAIVSASQLLLIRWIVSALDGAPTHEGWVFAGSAMGMVVTALPGLPQGWGTGDAAYVYFLDKAGLSPAIALAVCLTYRILYYAYVIVGVGLWGFESWRERSRKT